MYCMAPLSPRKGRLISFHDNDVDVSIVIMCCDQVITGGNYDVDLEIMAPGKRVLYKDMKKQYDSFTWTTDVEGEYQFCFSNEFSTFTHKLVYFDFQVMKTGFIFNRTALNAGWSSCEKGVSVSLSTCQARGLWQTEEKSVQIFISHERPFSLVFWEEEWLVGTTSFTWNFGSTGPRWSENVNFEPILTRSASAIIPS